VLLGLIVLYFVLRQVTPTPITRFGSSTESVGVANPSMMKASADTFGGISAPSFMPVQEYAPTPNITSRMVVQNSYLSLLVKDVVSTRKQIIDYAVSLGGYMVTSETTNPQDAPTATVTVRVPSTSLDTTLEKFRSLGVKVVSENLIGNDVTDQYVDIDARVATLEKTKAAMESILDRATLISDLSNITQQIIGIQSQIDALKGQQKSLSENAKYAKVTLYMSTDEIALPYAPSDTFRPAVIFKLAVRALVTSLRSVATAAIWIAVYAVIWVPVLILLYLLNRYISRKPRT
jgi:hypothetical protein